MKLKLDRTKIAECRKIARSVSSSMGKMIAQRSTVALERSVARLCGISGAFENRETGQFYPWANVVVDRLRQEEIIQQGALYWIANVCLREGKKPEELPKLLADPKFRFQTSTRENPAKIKKLADQIGKTAVQGIVANRKQRNRVIKECGDPRDPTFKKPPLKYVIVASGNIFEDVVQARSAAQAGADVIAVIRSTAQSLLDYVPHGATTVGFGGTYATQENFKIMRAALDEEGRNLKRYIRLTNYASGLCMPEITVMAAMERLDFLLCDSLYGILFRDINMQRTLIDQHFSRLVCAASEIFINTGEDNYLTTADAIENGHQVLASQFINERFALDANMQPEYMGLGHAMEMNPWTEDVILLEIARAQMTRDIFPKAPLKFMPPTRHKETDVFFSHVYDAIFNLVGVTTNQGIQLLGMPTEAIHTPLLQDRFYAIKSANYIFNGAQGLGAEIEFRRDGKIAKWATKVLNDTLKLLKKIERVGLFQALEEKVFAEVRRTPTGGKGFEGVFERAPNYCNPILARLEDKAYAD